MKKIMSQHIDLKNLDKSSWETFRFDKIAKCVSERVDPNTTELAIYVGLEHLDAENIHIKRHGSPADVKGQKLKCYPGDVIFGKRRAYQRKAAIANFEGICSAHAFVLRANPKVILPSLFPFFLHSDAFMHRAVDISVGGLSPTINWKNLREQEFLLPPKDQQVQLAELLWAMDEVVEREREVRIEASVLKKVILKKIFTRNWERSDAVLKRFDTNSFPLVRFSKVCSESMFGPRFSSKLYSDNGTVACLRTTDMDEDGNLNLNTMPKANLPDAKFEEHYLQKGDLIISRSGTCGLTGVFEGYSSPVLPAAFLIRFRISDKAVPQYLKLFFNSDIGRGITTSLASGAVQKNLTSKSLLNVQIPMPSIEIQREVIELVRQFSIDKIDTKINTSLALQKSLINQIF